MGCRYSGGRGRTGPGAGCRGGPRPACLCGKTWSAGRGKRIPLVRRRRPSLMGLPLAALRRLASGPRSAGGPATVQCRICSPVWERESSPLALSPQGVGRTLPSLCATRHAQRRRAAPGRCAPAGFTNPWPVSVRSTTDSVAPELFSSGAIPSAAARPAIRARRPGWGGLRAESSRSGWARRAGRPAACRLPPACGRPSCRCTGRRR